MFCRPVSLLDEEYLLIVVFFMLLTLVAIGKPSPALAFRGLLTIEREGIRQQGQSET